jgi:hypothetical protein
MIDAGEWVNALAAQADADFKAWQRYEEHPEALVAECHKLLFLQMACEKLCKAYLIQAGTAPEALRASHGYIAKPLPVIIRQQIIEMGRDPGQMQGVLRHVRYLAEEIEVLNPAIVRVGRRPDNCEYPWEGGHRVMSPLNWTFSLSRLCTAPAGRTFLKLLREAISRVLKAEQPP